MLTADQSSGRSVEYFPPGNVSLAFLKSEAFITAIMGPIGSGKSTVCVMKLLRNAMLQPMTASGFRRSRYAVIRNTFPELKTTTMQTWHQWIPKDIGRWVGQGPPTHHIIDPATKIDMEVWFVALDSPDDVKKLLSMELTGAWINEAREVPKVVLDGLSGRVGRFRPSVNEPHLWPYNPQILMDTNPPDTDHWWYALAEQDTSTAFGREMLRSMAESEAELRQLGHLGPRQRLFEFYRQPGAYEVGAENIENLPPGYYAKAKAGKSQDWVAVYVDGKYGFVRDGRPVFPEYNDRLHCQEFDLIPGLPIGVGLDFGLSPAAVFAQRTPEGQWRIRSEIVGEGMGLKRFAESIRAHVAEMYHGYRITRITGDPSGDNRSAMDAEERSTFQLLSSYKIHAYPASTNNIVPRIAAVVEPLSRLINGQPGMLIHPQCRLLRKGMAGGYCYKRVKVIGDERYQDKPDKNIYSHPCFVAGTEISTPSGRRRIEEIVAGDWVMTPIGARRVVYTMSRPAKVMTLTLTNGVEITCTPDHPFYTQHGYVHAEALQYRHLIGTESALWSFLFRSCQYAPQQNGPFSRLMVSAITGVLGITKQRMATTFTAMCGLRILATFRMATTFTTKITMAATTIRTTLSAWQKASIAPFTWTTMEGAHNHRLQCAKQSQQQWNGEKKTQGAPAKSEGAEARRWLRRWLQAGLMHSSAAGVEMSMLDTSNTKNEDFAARHAKEPLGKIAVWMMRTGSVLSAAMSSATTGIRRAKPVRVTAAGRCVRGYVYNIHVDDSHCYYANGMLVSNCDALQYLLLGGGEYSRIIDAGNELGPPERIEFYSPAVDGVM